jgi:uncharacterized protein YprB with RNaseH-like and TPR domain
MDIQEQLAQLRRRIARIDKKYAGGPKPAPVPAQNPDRPQRYDMAHWLGGCEVETAAGRHFETVRTWERHRRHGSIGIADLTSLPDDLLNEISGGDVPRAAPERWCFLDTETTGLAGGAGTYAFLVGVGAITGEGFQLKQFFMREFGEEPSLLAALAEHLSRFDVLVTYNGKIYDVPLLETRYRMCRARPPFSRLKHVDLLYSARRLWKLRFESCRLVELENQILGVDREGDLPGELIPMVYFEYLRTRQAFKLAPIFHHNAIDILTLACLTAVVPLAFRSPASAPLEHGAELVGLGRWLRKADRLEEALTLFRRAISMRLRDELLFRTLWDVAQLEKKLGRLEAAVAVLADLAAERNPFQCAALEELAKHYEHRERNPAMALEMVLAAQSLHDTEELRRRRARLERRIAATPNRLL